jgi:hypothetical protein
MTDQYSRPERAAELAIARRHRAEIYRDPCAHCLKRANGTVFGLGFCKDASRTFPRCLSTPGLQFELDHSTLRGTK